MKGWEQVKIKEICEVKGGKRLPLGLDFSDHGHPYIRARDIKNGKIKIEAPVFVTDAAREKIKRYITNTNDILITIVGVNIGDVGIVPCELNNANLTENAVKLTNYQGVSPKYLINYLTSPHCKEIMQQSAAGAAQGKLGIYKINEIKVILPPPTIQRKIAAVLSAYDDLIENTNRRINILEKMAEELYREWFVRLRFPGHEKAKIVKGVPEGWGPKRIKAVVERKGFGKIYRESELQPEGRIIVIDQSLNKYLGFYDGEPEHRASEDRPIMLFGDHSCKMQIMIEPFSLAENVIPFVAKGKMPTAFLFYMIHNSIETTEYKRHWTELINKEVYIPHEHLQIEFAKIVITHIHQKEKLIAINRRIKIIRDRLLSRLMSGRIDVEHLDIRFPASMKEEEAINA